MVRWTATPPRQRPSCGCADELTVRRADAFGRWTAALGQLLGGVEPDVANIGGDAAPLRARLQHLSELLAESEQTVLQLTAQEKVRRRFPGAYPRRGLIAD